MLKKMNKTTKNNLITYAMVILAFVIMQILISAGSISSLLQGLMVPLCTYIILAVSLNLVVGILGELSLGHAGFMCVGAFTSAFFSKCTRDVIASDGLRFFLALLIGIVTAAIFGMLVVYCGLCAKICPMGAIDPNDPSHIPGTCIKCCACTTYCPSGAKKFDDPDFLSHTAMLEKFWTEFRQENAVFL